MRTAVAILLLLVACKRERRELQPPEAQARPASLPPAHGLYAGPEPIAGTPLDPSMPGYEETAYAVSEGKQLYHYYNCTGCHSGGGGGAIGPAFIDDTWRYGSTPAEVATSILAGRPDGMPSYRSKLTSTQLYELVAYVRSFDGLVRGDAVPARDEHMKVEPTPTLQHHGMPLPGKDRP